MGRKRAEKPEDAQAELDSQPSRQEPEQQPQAELKKAAGRTIGAWRKDALNFLGKGASDTDVTERINKTAKEGGYDYQTNDTETAEWRARVQAELDGGSPPPSSPRTPRAQKIPPAHTGDVVSDMEMLKRLVERLGGDAVRRAVGLFE